MEPFGTGLLALLVPLWKGAAVDIAATQQLEAGLARLKVELPSGALAQLEAWADELLRWNDKVNLTAITRPVDVVDKHLLDSLAVLPEVADAQHLLDLGAGAGLPGIPLAVALPSLRVTLVDAVSKKVAFMKAAAVKAGVSTRVRAVHARLNGDASREGLPLVDTVISRAFMDVAPFLSLARHYLAPAGRVVAMLGQTPPDDDLAETGRRAGLALSTVRRFTLPVSGDPRGVAVFTSP
jgi:16S rRNA (guanine527-N7)-methyltransferase